MDVSNSLEQCTLAYKLILYAQLREARLKGNHKLIASIQEKINQDQVEISASAPSGTVVDRYARMQGNDQKINLSELIDRLKQLENPDRNDQQQTTVSAVQVQIKQTIKTEFSFQYTTLKKVDGLVRNSQNQAETDRYLFDFIDGITFKITDKWNDCSTTVWGDPHVDVDDVDGNYDGDFKDLGFSDTQTTFMLLDGTRVTFTALDEGEIEKVDIFKDNQHLSGIGTASADYSEENQLFNSEVKKNDGESATVPMGDTVYAGGDGNDWFTSKGDLVWGETTDTPVDSRPSSILKMEYKQEISQEVDIQVSTVQVDTQA